MIEKIEKRHYFLVIIGLILLFTPITLIAYYSIIPSQSLQNFIAYVFLFISSSLGTALIVTAINSIFASETEHNTINFVKTKINEQNKKLNKKFIIFDEIEKCKIEHIFESRRKDSNFKKVLLGEFNRVENNKKVLLMGISLRDFFLNDDEKYSETIDEMLKKDISFNILLLDPISDAAKNRAFLEEEELFEEDGYIHTTLFNDISKIAKRLNDPTIITDDLKMQERINTQIEVRFYPYDPSTHIIITDKSTFVEQYHWGGDKSIREYSKGKYLGKVNRTGGFTPVIMLSNESFFSKLLKDHFCNMWASVEEKSLKNDYLDKIIKFKENNK